jgi:AraC-like DNA-binding protein
MKSASGISAWNLNHLIAALDVKAVALSERVLSPGCNLVTTGHASPGIHYVLEGTGLMYFHNDPPFKICAHTLIIAPPNCPFRLEVFSDEQVDMRAELEGGDGLEVTDQILRLTDGHAEPKILMICGLFKTSCGSTSELFETLPGPIILNFSAIDRLDAKLKIAMREFISKEIGAGAMTAALLKQVIVALVRKSLDSMHVWVERFSMLSDPTIAHVFAEMVAQPGKVHSIHTLAETACLSRSAFIVRFTNAIGRSPMMVLRDLRMRQAAADLLAGNISLDHVSRNTGYASRSSFSRAFKEAYGVDPSAYRKSTQGHESV